MAQAIGLQSIARDLGFDWTIDMYSDATAAIGIARRRGMGRIRHIDCTDLWVQEKFNSGQAKLHKVLGAENPADILTKHVDRSLLNKMLDKVGMKFLDGRSAIAPETMGINSLTTRRGRRQQRHSQDMQTPMVDTQEMAHLNADHGSLCCLCVRDGTTIAETEDVDTTKCKEISEPSPGHVEILAQEGCRNTVCAAYHTDSLPGKVVKAFLPQMVQKIPMHFDGETGPEILKLQSLGKAGIEE